MTNPLVQRWACHYINEIIPLVYHLSNDTVRNKNNKVTLVYQEQKVREYFCTLRKIISDHVKYSRKPLHYVLAKLHWIAIVEKLT